MLTSNAFPSKCESRRTHYNRLSSRVVIPEKLLPCFIPTKKRVDCGGIYSRISPFTSLTNTGKKLGAAVIPDGFRFVAPKSKRIGLSLSTLTQGGSFFCHLICLAFFFALLTFFRESLRGFFLVVDSPRGSLAYYFGSVVRRCGL